ncbi:MAG: YceD family protein [Elusimicrobiales bacterium]|nr:hypothetical protein [Elusimicrobiales bacterium]HOL62897.1 hypothetical protein [Elusimicrobiales bacterium]HPO95955.1 hypothetical protein [Elusimicrobiales bacterium]
MNKNVFEYDIKKIKRDGGLTENYDSDIALFSNCLSPITSLNRINISVEFYLNENSVLLTGKVEAKAKTVCSRCGKEMEIDMSEEFEETYETEETVNIKPLIDEALTLSEPLKSVCQKDCSKKQVENFELKRFKIK